MKNDFEKIIVDLEKKSLTQKDVFQMIADKLFEKHFIKNKDNLILKLNEREENISTGIGEGIAIPHANVKELQKPKVFVFRLKNSMNWKGSLDGKKVDLIISILVPENNRNEHFEILTKFSSSLADKKNIKKFRTLSKKELISLIDNEILNEKKEVKQKEERERDNKQISIVGVTTCPTGIAHTFMAATAIEKEAKARGWKVKVEKQAQITKDKLTAQDIKDADYVLFAAGKGIDEIERFYGKNLYEVEVAKPITKAKEVLDDLLIKAKPFNMAGATKGESQVNSIDKEKKGFSQGPIRHLLTGISYMIPFIAMAGIVLGITSAAGFDTGWINPDTGIVVPGPYDVHPDGWDETWTYGFAPINNAAMAVNTVAGDAFTLFIPVLGGYIAYSIAGRHAIAPAMITSFYLNDTSGTALWNYQEGTFGNFGSDHLVSLGFLGAIAAGYLIGYSVSWWTKKTNGIKSAAFQAINPLLIVPIVFTMIPWIFFAFIGYLPLYWIAYGLGEGIDALVEANLLWIAGGIMGIMICFDLGGPVNKMAMVIGVAYLAENNYFPLLNGVCAVCVSIPPLVLFLACYLGKYLGFKMDEPDKAMATTAGIMGFFGITEGSIPFAAKDPKRYMPAFMFAGFIAGMLAIAAGVGNNVAMWGGPIIYIAGGMGHSPDNVTTSANFMATDWAYAAWYFVPLIIGGFAGLLALAFLNWIYSRKEKNKNTNVIEEKERKEKNKKLNNKKQKNLEYSIYIKSLSKVN